jgi:hypothetical protein
MEPVQVGGLSYRMPEGTVAVTSRATSTQLEFALGQTREIEPTE